MDAFFAKVKIIRVQQFFARCFLVFFRLVRFFSGRLRFLIKNYFYICSPETRVSGSVIRRDAGVVDRAALEMRCTGNCTGGSNPSLSAIEPDNQDFILSTPNFTPRNVKLGVFFEMK